MRELDQLLLRWLERDAPAASGEQLASFEALLEAEDSELWRWMIGRDQPARADWQALIARIRGPA